MMSPADGSSATRLRPRRLTDQVIEVLTRDIVAGRIPPGATLPSEPELVARFGISKVAVREATQVLGAVGLVSVQQGKRSLVLHPREWNFLSPIIQDAIRHERGATYLLEQLFGARLLLEPPAAAEAAGRLTDAALPELERLVETMTAVAADPGDLGTFLEADREFHARITELIQNDVVRSMIRDLHRQMYENWTDSRLQADDLEVFAHLHAEILEAIRRGDGESARDAMTRHLLAAREIEVGRRAFSSRLPGGSQ